MNVTELGMYSSTRMFMVKRQGTTTGGTVENENHPKTGDQHADTKRTGGLWTDTTEQQGTHQVSHIPTIQSMKHILKQILTR